MSEQKIYAPARRAKLIKTQNGDMLKLSFKVDEIVEWLEENVNGQGYINVNITERKEVGQYGDTHTMWLDTWKPDKSKSKDKAQKASKKEEPLDIGDEEDIPF